MLPVNIPFKVLLTLHAGFDVLDFTGPLEILSSARFETNNAKAFHCTVVASEELTVADQGCAIQRHMSINDALSRIAEFNILVVPGGESSGVIERKDPVLNVIRAFAGLPRELESSITRQRVLMSVCTGSLILGN